MERGFCAGEILMPPVPHFLQEGGDTVGTIVQYGVFAAIKICSIIRVIERSCLFLFNASLGTFLAASWISCMVRSLHVDLPIDVVPVVVPVLPVTSLLCLGLSLKQAYISQVQESYCGIRL